MSVKKIDDFRNLPTTSILRVFPTLEDEDKIAFSNVLRAYKVSEESQNNSFLFQFYIVEDNEFIDDISAKFYGTPLLWWVISDYNNMTNPYEELVPGSSIKILRREYLFAIFDDLKTIGEL